jgi:hypothetical protein
MTGRLNIVHCTMMVGQERGKQAGMHRQHAETGL